MVRGCLVLLVLAVVITGIHSQLDSLGFISIDCGLPANSSIVETDTKLTYVSDEQFIDTGVNSQIRSNQHTSENLSKQLLTVRSFPHGTRNCYTLRSLTIGSKYLVRAAFMYGNYNNLNKLPIFDIHLGVNYWDTINTTTADDFYYTEIIAMTTSDYLQVCLINKKQGTPYISWLDLRPLETNIYEAANSTQSLVCFYRLNVGASSLVRYPDDPYDRIWENYTWNQWTEIFTNSIIQPDKEFSTPSLVMQTAATSSSTEEPLDLSWSCNNESVVFFVILHISEIEDVPSTDLREFNVLANGGFVYNYVPQELYSGWATYTHTGDTKYSVSLEATSNSTLPPLWNAIEVYVITPASGIPTNSGDVTAINTIKTNYKLKKDWSGDPCAPTELSWTGVTCATDSTNIPRITALNLSSSGMTGAIISFFGNLSSLESLDLSDNDLSGVLPTVLEQLTALTYLDITGNSKISTTLPAALQKKQQDGALAYKFGDSTKPSNKKKIPVVIIAVVVVIMVLLIAVAIILILCLKRPKQNQINIPKPHESYGSTPLANHYAGNYANSPEAPNIPHAYSAGSNYASISQPNGAGEGM